MIYGSVCSGIEAATLAWHPLGWNPAWFSEIKPFPCKLLKYYYPSVPNLGDMLKIEINETFQKTHIDLLVGGTPCQSFSTAGLRRGLADERGNLALQFCRILAIKRPRWFVWENVPGVFSVEGGAAFRSIIAEFSECGYSFSWRMLDAQFFGVPQRRRRVFVVGYLGNDWRPPAAVLFEPKSLQGNSPQGSDKKQTIAALTATGVGTSGADDNQAQAGHLIVTPLISKSYTDNENRENNLICGTIDASYGRLQGCAGQDAGHGHSTLVRYFEPRVGRNDRGGLDNISAPLKAQNGETGKGDGAPCILWSIMPQNSGKDYKAKICDVSQPLGTQISVSCDQGGDIVQQKAVVRRLTPVECERLQGFPDNYTNIPGANDSSRYEAIGNSMAIDVMRWIGEQIDFYDKVF